MLRCLALTMPGRHGVLETERVADRDHPLAGPHALGIAERQREERLLGFDLDQPDVGLRIAPDHGGGQLAPIVELDRDLLDVFDHVIVGDDVPVWRDHESGAQTGNHLLVLARHALLGDLERKVRDAEPLLEWVSRERLLGADVDHARRAGLGQVGERVRDAVGDDGLLAGALLPERLVGSRGLLFGLGLLAEQVEGVRVVGEPAHVDLQGAAGEQRCKGDPDHRADLDESPHDTSLRCGAAQRVL